MHSKRLGDAGRCARLVSLSGPDSEEEEH